jgi:hypothetical protein
MPEYLTCVECGEPDERCECPPCALCRSRPGDCICHETDLSSCPYYNGTGICSFGCREEPRCRTEEPLNGWPSMRKAAPDAHS